MKQQKEKQIGENSSQIENIPCENIIAEQTDDWKSATRRLE